MSKVIAIGRRGDILPFKAAGVELLEIEGAEGAAAAFDSIMDMPDPCVVFVTEDLAEAAQAEIERFRRTRKRAVLAIPTLLKAPGLRLGEIRELVARALGVDLLGREG